MQGSVARWELMARQKLAAAGAVAERAAVGASAGSPVVRHPLPEQSSVSRSDGHAWCSSMTGRECDPYALAGE